MIIKEGGNMAFQLDKREMRLLQLIKNKEKAWRSARWLSLIFSSFCIGYPIYYSVDAIKHLPEIKKFDPIWIYSDIAIATAHAVLITLMILLFYGGIYVCKLS